MDQLYTAALALAAAMPQSSPEPTNDSLFPPRGHTCTEITNNSPFYDDCKMASQQIRSSPPEIDCESENPQYQHDVITVDTCTVHTYSQKGNARCLNRNYILIGIEDILRECSTDDGYTQGSYTWTQEGEPREGVKLIRSASEQ